MYELGSLTCVCVGFDVIHIRFGLDSFSIIRVFIVYVGNIFLFISCWGGGNIGFCYNFHFPSSNQNSNSIK